MPLPVHVIKKNSSYRFRQEMRGKKLTLPNFILNPVLPSAEVGAVPLAVDLALGGAARRFLSSSSFCRSGCGSFGDGGRFVGRTLREERVSVDEPQIYLSTSMSYNRYNMREQTVCDVHYSASHLMVPRIMVQFGLRVRFSQDKKAKPFSGTHLKRKLLLLTNSAVVFYPISEKTLPTP